MDERIYLIVLLSALASYMWRGMGVAIAGRMRADGRLLDWLNCVAYAMLAGLLARVLIMPVGLLAETSSIARIGAMLVGFIVFVVLERQYFYATVISTLAFYLIVSYV